MRNAIYLGLYLGLMVSVTQAKAEWLTDNRLSLATDYIYRGVSLGDQQLTPSINVSTTHSSGLSLSLWASRTEIAGLAGTAVNRETEVEYSLGYNKQLNQNWVLNISHAWLEYDQSNQPRNHDYRESRLSLHYTDQTTLLLSHTNSIWNTGANLTSLALLQRFALPLNLAGETELGVVDLASNNRTFYPYLRVSVGLLLTEHWNASVDYHFSASAANDFFNSDRTGSQFVGRISYLF